MFAADAAVQHRVFLTAFLYGHLHQLADAGLVQFAEGIKLINFLVVIAFQEFARIVPGEAKGHLGQVVGAKAEEVGFLRHVIRCQRGSRDFDHGADLVIQEVALFFHNLFRGFHDDILYEQQFFAFPGQRYHDLGNDIVIHFFLNSNGRFDHGAGLHTGNFRINDAEAAAAQAHHGVELVHGVAAGFHFFVGQAHAVPQFPHFRFRLGQELMQRRIQETNRHRTAPQRFVHADKVFALIRKQFGQRRFPLFHGIRQDHAAELGNAFRFKEHMLRTAQADAFRA